MAALIVSCGNQSIDVRLLSSSDVILNEVTDGQACPYKPIWPQRESQAAQAGTARPSPRPLRASLFPAKGPNGALSERPRPGAAPRAAAAAAAAGAGAQQDRARAGELRAKREEPQPPGPRRRRRRCCTKPRARPGAMSASAGGGHQPSQSRAIPTRTVAISDAAQLPQDYCTTPGGTLFSTTPGGTRIIYDRKFLLDRRNSPMAQTPPCHLPNIPGVTSPGALMEDSKVEVNNLNNHDRKHAVGDEAQFEMDI